MTDRGSVRAGGLRGVGRWVVDTGLWLLLGAPLLLLPVRAAADAWRAPALMPQRWGTRGVELALAPGNRVLEATANALLVAVVVTGVALVVGWGAARWLATAAPRRRVAVLVVLALPVLVPPLVIGSGLSTWALRLGLADRLAGLALTHLVLVLPYVVLALAPAFTPSVRAAEEVAATLGLSPRRVLVAVTLPMTRPAIGVASLVGGLVSWSQYGTSLGVGGGIPMLPLVLEPVVGSDRQFAAVLALVTLAVPLLAVPALVADRGGSAWADGT